MGQEAAKQKDNMTENYTVVKTISPGEFWVRRKKKGDQLQLRVFTFYLEDEMLQYIKLLEKRKKIKNPHLLELIQHKRITEQHMCSQTFKIRTVVQYPFKTIKEEIMQRGGVIPKRYFSQDQMWSILYSCCHALYALYINKFFHQSLNTEQMFIDTAGLIKIADNVLVNSTKNYLSLMNQGDISPSFRYISPELVNLVEDNNFYLYEKEKSDVYILAMIMLEVGNLTQVSYYNKNSKKFNFQTSMIALNELRSRYSLKFCNILERMLLLDFKDRPRFEDIIGNIEQKTIYTGSSANTSMISNPDLNKKIVNIHSKQTSNLSNPDPVKQQRNWSLPPLLIQNYSNVSLQRPSLNTNKDIYNAPFMVPIQNYHQSQNQTFPLTNTPIQYQKNQPYLNNIQLQNGYSQPNGPSIPREQIKPQFWKIDSILRDIGLKNESSYTPYQELLNLTEKGKSIPTNPISSFQFNKKETVSSLPIAKPNINIAYSEFSNVPQPTVIPKFEVVPSLQSSEFVLQGRRFSQSKFGKIKLPNDVIPTVHQKQQAQQQINNSQQKIKKSLVDQHKLPEQFTKSKFVIEVTQQGKFEGFIVNGSRNGIGRLIYASGSCYEGQWRDNKMQGYGKLYYQNGNVAYEGHWKKGKFSGTGKMYNDDPSLQSASSPIDYKDLSKVGERWVWYEGQFEEDQRNGRGQMGFVNGEMFSGIFNKDDVSGEGTFYCLDGQVIKGIWLNNLYTESP